MKIDQLFQTVVRGKVAIVRLHEEEQTDHDGRLIVELFNYSII